LTSASIDHQWLWSGDFLFIIVYLLLLVFINAKPVSYDGWKYHSIDIFAQNRDGLA